MIIDSVYRKLAYIRCIKL